jgi:hypothetical protein
MSGNFQARSLISSFEKASWSLKLSNKFTNGHTKFLRRKASLLISEAHGFRISKQEVPKQ